jgi:CHAT domain-containing protein
VLAEKRAKRKDFRATLFGGLNYDTSVESLLADAENYPELRNRGYVADNAFRANRESDAEIPPLPGTLKEVNAISDILATGKHVKANMKVGNDGTETAFKALSGKYGSVLHVSTHGFFSAVDGRQDSAEQTFEDLALDGCGLLMAGASHRYLDEEALPNNLDDGILKASEIAKLDLKGVDLAVLSACETGLGAVTGDGVFGLQRGFKKGGVNSILMSLWKVDDDATCALMTAFYTNWLQGKSKYESLELAKASVRTVPRWSDPQYWAAFILLDALN